MKKLLLATTILVPFAVANDPTTASAQVAPPTYNWSGFYVGGQVGGGLIKEPSGGSSNQESNGNLTQFGTRPLLGGNSDPGNGTGAIAGGQAGYNYQQGNWLFGVEGEGFWSGIKMASTGSSFNSNGSIFDTFGTIVKNTSDYTIAGRLGIVFDRTLIYGKGGWAWGSHSFYAFESCCNTTPVTSSASASGTLDGMMVGIGIEHALTQNWTVKLEYDYIAFGPKELLVTTCSGTVCSTPGTTSFNSTKQVFKVGTNYLFHVGGP
jgi:outer membrane immunogenic protein